MNNCYTTFVRKINNIIKKVMVWEEFSNDSKITNISKEFVKQVQADTLAYLLDDEQLKITLSTKRFTEATRRLCLHEFICKPYENKQIIHDILGNEILEIKGKTDYKGRAQYISWLEPTDEVIQEAIEHLFRDGAYHIAFFKGNQLQRVVRRICIFNDVLSEERLIENFRVITLIQPEFRAEGICRYQADR